MSNYEVKVWTMPPVLAEVTGRFSDIDEVLEHVITIIKKGKYNLDDIEVWDNDQHKKLDIKVSEVSVYGKKTILHQH